MTMATMTYLKRETERIRMESEQLQNSSPSNKRLKLTTTNLQDILSHLPEPLINHILNFLDMKQIVQTCLLSKRWQNLWESIPNLYFNDLKWYLTQTGPGRKFKKNKFRYFVDSVLLLRDGSDIQKFTLYFSSSCVSDNKRLDRWISYALRRNVQVLTFGATEFFHTNVIRLSGYVKTLEFKGVFFPCDNGSDDGVLNMDLVNVEHLLFEDCGYCNVKKLVVNAPELKSLMIDTYDKRLNHSTVVKICCPKMVVILCKGYMFKDYTLENCGNVVIAKIDTIVNPIEKGLPDIPKMDGEGFGQCLNKLIHGLGNVRCLTLSAHGLQSFSGLPNMLEPAITCRRLKYLKLKLIRWCNDAYIHSIAKLLEILPNLETLVLERNETMSDLEKEGTDWGQQLSFECLLLHLKFIEISNLQKSENELQFIEFLLKNAPILEKITVTVFIRLTDEKDEVLDFLIKLLSLCHASEVELSYIMVGKI